MTGLFTRLFVSPEQRGYASDHRIALWLFVGLAMQGILGLLIPDFRSNTAITESLPDWMTFVVYGFFAFGGLSAIQGLCRGWYRAEAAGCVLIGTATSIQFLANVQQFDLSTLAGNIVVLAISIGMFSRAGHTVSGHVRNRGDQLNTEDLEELQGLLSDLKKPNGQV